MKQLMASCAWPPSLVWLPPAFLPPLHQACWHTTGGYQTSPWSPCLQIPVRRWRATVGYENLMVLNCIQKGWAHGDPGPCWWDKVELIAATQQKRPNTNTRLRGATLKCASAMTPHLLPPPFHNACYSSWTLAYGDCLNKGLTAPAPC